MSKKFEATARAIIDNIGGAENVAGLHHCQTRLRFNLVDNGKANSEALEKLDSVSKVLEKGGMYQVVIGMDVADCYEEIVKLLPKLGDGAAQQEGKKEKQKPFDLVADFISSIFSPIVPALAGAGMVKALLALLVAFNWIDKSGQTYVILNLFGDATFAFMPILLAYTTAKKLNCNQIIAAVVAGIMCHATWTGLVSAGEAVHFFGIPFYLVRYTGSVIPIVLVLLAQAPIEKFLNKIVPKSIRLVIVPMVEFIVMGTLALSILGPLGDYVGKIFTLIFTFLSEKVGWLECMVMGGLYSPLVIFGLHHGLAPLGTMQMSQMGYDGIFGPGVLCANIGQGTAALVAGLISKDSKTRQIGVSAGITGLMGTTEPALYGINVPKKFPIIAGMLGGACGGLYAGLTHTHRYATGSSGLPAVVMYIGDNTLQYFYNILIALAITMIVAAVMTVVLSKVFKGKSEDAAEASAPKAPAFDVPSDTVAAPADGELVPMVEIPDETFATGVLGSGVGIKPITGTIVAPFNGKVTQVADSGHALGLESADGLELLIHVGVDTVDMNGKGFSPKVKVGDAIVAGQTLLTFDRKAIKDAGHPDIVVVMLTNADEYGKVECGGAGTVKAGTAIIKAER